MGMMMGSLETLQLIHNLIYATNAKKVLDIGVFTGCSALAEALALPDDGKVVACDVNENSVNVGKPIWKEAGVYDKIDLRIAPALETLDELIANGEAGTFDFAFIDADKGNYLNYYERCLVLLKPRGIIAVDNVLATGKVVEKDCNDDRTTSLKNFNTALKDDPRIKISMLYAGDGLTLAFKL
ncbi:catechol O-methyltransferase domain-containing protein 1-like [Centruroides sculpturatus]|uniref:catechol O-methyltransferase domain-containing protein 1-like n=1 Tax=Centruroides sculpturatus TaxID=218467 RepID=UPI000C6E35C3|nr:catechol O-methyltransferase domain-containing protein 1-like [Centruroides sculpturatus]